MMTEFKALKQKINWYQNQQVLDQQTIHDKDKDIALLQRQLGETRVKLADAMDKYIDLMKEKIERLEKDQSGL